MTRSFLAAVLVAAASTVAQAQGDFHWEKALAAGSEVSISNINGNITVVPSTTGRVEVVGTKRGDSRYFDQIRTQIEETSRGVQVCVIFEDGRSCDDQGSHSRRRGDRDWHNLSMNLQVAVPTSLLVSSHTVSGDIEVTGAHGDVDAGSVSGDVRLEKLHASSVRASTVSGDVDASIEQFTGQGDLSFHSVSGNVTLEVPRDFNADVAMNSVSGTINSDFAMTLTNGRMRRRNIEARIGNGGRRVDVNTVSGDLRIRMAR